ncbi:MAG: primosomal protein N' [Defluviitaleaceae bacterium]|nr:primosomal protein N' [Defluviitaleaceae bacterium]
MNSNKAQAAETTKAIETTGNFAEVIISSISSAINRGFYYRVPDALIEKIQIGMRVLVPFGKSRSYEGFVIAKISVIDIEEERIKSILDILEDFPIFSAHMLELAHWMSEKYFTPLAVCLRCIMPAGISMKNDYAVCVINEFEGNRKGKIYQVFKYIKEHGKISQRELVENFGQNIYQTLKTLENKALIRIDHIYDVKDYSLRIAIARINAENPDFERLAKNILAKGKNKNDKQAKVLSMLMENISMPVGDIRAFLNITASPIKSLEKQGLICIEQIKVQRDLNKYYDSPSIAITPTQEQSAAIESLKKKSEQKDLRPTLIQGVTGSGKTEIYLQIIEEILNQGKQAIMLVPEISLTPQAIEVFVRRLGEKVAFTHSRLSLGERYDQWKRAKDNRAAVMIGPRSAIFTPFDNLGVIIIDEEHESTYKSETAPKYHTRDIAEKLGTLTNALVIMGSATPDLATYHMAKTGHYDLISLPKRINNQFAHIEIADMRLELEQGNKTIFSQALYKAINENLKKKQQTILFLNRRGHSTFISCRACGHVMQCEQCNVNYTFHNSVNKLICHYCASQETKPKNCPTCGSKHINLFGIGTQKVEESVAEFFPNARTIRMDLDTTSKKNSHERIIAEFAEQKADILIGTQMIAKGLNFPQVSLVGIIAADMAINIGDYRSAEIAYQLITQVSGRAGRESIPGRAIIQTYSPEHYAIIHAIESDYEKFYQTEIEIRRQMTYPPFSNVFQVLFLGEDEKKLIQAMQNLGTLMRGCNRKGLCSILGPAPAVISKIRGQFRWKILIKCIDENILKQFALYCVEKLKQYFDVSGITMNLTLNPVNIA